MPDANRGVILCQIGPAIVIDVCYEETHDLGNIITDHPVEQGADISDHVRPEPDRVTLHCWVSNTPISQAEMTRAVALGVATSSNQVQQVPGRGKAVFDKLYDLRNQGTLVSVVTTLKTYGVSSKQGMVIERLSVPRTTKNYDGLEWTVTLKQVFVVENKFTQQSIPKDVRASKKKSIGAQTTADASDQNSALFNSAKSLSQSSNGTAAKLGKFLLNQ